MTAHVMLLKSLRVTIIVYTKRGEKLQIIREKHGKVDKSPKEHKAPQR